jgi:hypothetical protein
VARAAWRYGSQTASVRAAQCWLPISTRAFSTATCERAYHAIAAVFSRAGADATFGARLPALLTGAGLEDIGGEVHTPIVTGVSGEWVRLSYEHLRQPMLTTGLLTEADVGRDSAFLSDPNSLYLPPFMVSAWGRRGDTTS